MLAGAINLMKEIKERTNSIYLEGRPARQMEEHSHETLSSSFWAQAKLWAPVQRRRIAAANGEWTCLRQSPRAADCL